jgi:hypothetical protein
MTAIDLDECSDVTGGFLFLPGPCSPWPGPTFPVPLPWPGPFPGPTPFPIAITAHFPICALVD